MSASKVSIRRLAGAGLAAGAWVFVSGLLMAAAFGYRDMSAAFTRIGLAIPTGSASFVTHTVVRFGLGMAIVVLFAIAARVLPATRAVILAAGLAWILASVFPVMVMTDWGLFPLALAWKVWAWTAAEFLLAAFIGRLLYAR